MLNKKLYSYKLALPAIALYSILFVFPLVFGLLYSLTDWRSDTDVVNFIGLENFKTILSDSQLLHSIGNTLKYAIVVVIFKNLLGLVLALGVNIQLDSKNMINNFFRTIFYMPAVISTIVIGLVFSKVLHPEGILNNFFNSLGLGFMAKDWLIDTRIVIYVIAAVSVWQWAGYHMAIYIAGLQSIPKDYYEAAMIDGATPFQRLKFITLPMLAPSININVILSLIGGLKGFSEVYALTNGGPGNASQVITTEVLSKFAQGSWGLGTALNTMLMILVAAVCIPLLKAMRRQEVED